MQSQRVAMVTGGAQRVGRAIVLRLAHAGYDVAFTYLKSERGAEELISEVKGLGREAIAIWADLTDPADAVEEVVGELNQAFGRLDVLVNNASLYERSGLEDATLEQGRRLWAIHVESPLLLCQRFGPMLRSSRGRVVNMLDLLAEKPWPAYAVYSATKAALWNLTMSLSRELAPEVTVNGIAPGVVEWPADYPEVERQKYLRRVPLGRAGEAEDVAKLVEYLCGPGGYITGQIIRLDGGRSVT